MMLVVMWYDAWRERSNDSSSRLFLASLACAFVSMALEAIMWFMSGTGGFPPRLVLATNTAYLIVACASTLLWPAYLHVQLFGGRSLLERRAVAAAAIVSYTIMALLILANCAYGFIFSIDAAGTYHRGPLFFIPYILMMAYLAASFVAALAVSARQESKDLRARYAILAGAGLLPVVGAVVQMSFYGWWVMWPSVVVMLLLVYLTVQNRRIENDPLTGLSNRRAFDRRLRACLHHPLAEGAWCLVVIDVDGLKTLNDKYGHAAGDEALRCMGDVLHAAFDEEEDAFLARFGGDEFAVLVPSIDDDDAREMVEFLESEARRQSTSSALMPLCFSAGYARHTDSTQTAEQLLQQADAAMYASKQARRRVAMGGLGAGSAPESSIRGGGA